ncbi:MAG: Hsp70 family protein [Pyrinomonadaceae bacterium]
MEDSVVYGIDLGTTFSAVARVNQQGDPVCISLGDEGEWTIPSAVLFDDQKVFVGAQAIENCWKPDTLLVEFAKRFIGLQSPGWPRQYSGWQYVPEEISALILRKLVKQIARQRNLPPVRDVVVSHPQWFYMSQKETTREAVELAGLNLLATITEPNAAAIAYGVYEQSADKDSTVLVFDLGGGTFDVSLMRVGHRRFEMIGSAGDTHLGGMDWDHEIISRAKEKFQTAVGEAFDDVASDEEHVQLRKAAERAKKKLSETEEVGFWVVAQGSKTVVEITRTEFEAITRPLLLRCLRRCEELFEQTSYDWRRVDEILLVGSSTKMPMIAEAIKRIAGKEPRLDEDPKLMVAKGAAIWGEWIKSGKIDARWAAEEGATQATGLEDRTTPTVIGRTAHGLGILVTRERDPNALRGAEQPETVVDLLIEPNTATPHTYDKVFYTNRDNETAIPVPLYEGESKDPQECSRIGQVVIEGLPPRPKHQPVRVKFHIDTSGLLEVEITDVETGRSTVQRLSKNILRASAPEQNAKLDLAARRRHLDTLEVM